MLRNATPPGDLLLRLVFVFSKVLDDTLKPMMIINRKNNYAEANDWDDEIFSGLC